MTFETSKDITVSNKGFRFAVRGTAFSSIFILLSTIVGAGTLSLPFAFAQGGIVYSSVVLAIVMVSACVADIVSASSRSPYVSMPTKVHDSRMIVPMHVRVHTCHYNNRTR